MGTAVIVSWITPKAPGPDVVIYWKENSTEKKLAVGKIATYTYYNYTSGFIHHANVSDLEV